MANKRLTTSIGYSNRCFAKNWKWKKKVNKHTNVCAALKCVSLSYRIIGYLPKFACSILQSKHKYTCIWMVGIENKKEIPTESKIQSSWTMKKFLFYQTNNRVAQSLFWANGWARVRSPLTFIHSFSQMDRKLFHYCYHYYLKWTKLFSFPFSFALFFSFSFVLIYLFFTSYRNKHTQTNACHHKWTINPYDTIHAVCTNVCFCTRAC